MTAPGHPFAQPGDAFFTRGRGLRSRLVLWGQTSPGEEKSWPSHMGIVTRPGYFVAPPGTSRNSMAWVSEALWRVGHHNWWSRYRTSHGYAYAIYRPRLVHDAAIGAIVRDALSRTGQRYAWWRMLSFVTDKIKLPGAKLHFLRSRNVCSTHAALGFAAGGVRYGRKDPKEVDPDFAHDYSKANPQEWLYIGWGVVP